MYQISEKAPFILVKLTGAATLDAIIAAIHTLFRMPSYLQSNDIWEFADELFNIEIGQLQIITEFIAQNYPPGATRTKSALVAGSGFNAAITELWAATTGELPYEVSVFSSMKEAMAWVAI